jgi:hypothetical protein
MTELKAYFLQMHLEQVKQHHEYIALGKFDESWIQARYFQWK